MKNFLSSISFRRLFVSRAMPPPPTPHSPRKGGRGVSVLLLWGAILTASSLPGSLSNGKRLKTPAPPMPRGVYRDKVTKERRAQGTGQVQKPAGQHSTPGLWPLLCWAGSGLQGHPVPLAVRDELNPPPPTLCPLCVFTDENIQSRLPGGKRLSSRDSGM